MIPNEWNRYIDNARRCLTQVELEMMETDLGDRDRITALLAEANSYMVCLNNVQRERDVSKSPYANGRRPF